MLQCSTLRVKHLLRAIRTPAPLPRHKNKTYGTNMPASQSLEAGSHHGACSRTPAYAADGQTADLHFGAKAWIGGLGLNLGSELWSQSLDRNGGVHAQSAGSQPQFASTLQS